MLKRIPVYSSPTPQKIQPMGLAGRREAMSAPTVGNASESIPVSTAKAGAGLCENTQALLVRLSSVEKSSERVSTMSATHTAHTDHANQAAVRRLILPTSRSCFFVPFVTTITLQDRILSSISTTVTGHLDEAAIAPTHGSILMCPPVSEL